MLFFFCGEKVENQELSGVYLTNSGKIRNSSKSGKIRKIRSRLTDCWPWCFRNWNWWQCCCCFDAFICPIIVIQISLLLNYLDFFLLTECHIKSVMNWFFKVVKCIDYKIYYSTTRPELAVKLSFFCFYFRKESLL